MKSFNRTKQVTVMVRRISKLSLSFPFSYIAFIKLQLKKLAVILRVGVSSLVSY